MNYYELSSKIQVFIGGKTDFHFLTLKSLPFETIKIFFESINFENCYFIFFSETLGVYICFEVWGQFLVKELCIELNTMML